jgi:5-methylcytosine-specific restriction enzyme A
MQRPQVRMQGRGVRVPTGRVATEAHRDAQAWRRWYKTTRWNKLRMLVLTRDLFICQRPGCGRVCDGKGEAVCDHKRPHHGDEAMFWDEANLWCLCKACHDGWKARIEAADRIRGAGFGL